MSYQCFYCDYEVEDHQVHFVHFYNAEREREEPMCDVCYAEWLEGIKE